MKITTKTTKEQLKSFLGANAKKVKETDKALFDQIAYADKMAKKDDSKVARKDLVDLVKAVMNLLGDKCVEPALAQEKTTPATPQAENSVKKLAKGASKKQEVKKTEETTPEVSEEETAEEAQEETTKGAEKKAPKKSSGSKKPATKKDGVQIVEGSEKTVQLAKQFPATITDGEKTYEVAHDIKTMDDLYNALEAEEEIVFAYYWTKRHLKQFPYFNGWLGQPKSFDNDLDLSATIYVSENKAVAYNVSLYTEAVYTILPVDLEETDGLRFCDGMEYQIYRAV